MNNFIKDRARQEIFNINPYVPGKPIEEVKRELGLKDIIKLASNENPLGSSPKAVKTIKKSLDELHLYPDSNCYYLKEKLASVTGIKKEGILIGNGSDELLKLVAETFLNRGDEVIFADPSFSEYEFTAKIMGAECKSIPLVDFKHDLEAMLAAVTEKTKIIFICNPNNPTGTIVDADEMDEFMAQVPEDILVIIDEAYVEYVENSGFPRSLDYINQGKNVIVMRTFSKIYGLAALRIGYGLTTVDIAQAVERVMEPFNVNMLAQKGAAAGLDDFEHVEESKKVNSLGKQFLYGEFNKMGLIYVETEANFIFVDVQKDCQEVFKKLLQKGIIVRTGDIFGYSTYIRVTIGSKDENIRFINGLKTILEG
jgi:histidinol-phosphate aminotransferase